MEQNKDYIKHFFDLDVYQRMSRLSKVVIRKVIPKLPPEERFDLGRQMRRASKAGPAAIAEGFPKRFKMRQWDRYLTDAIGECEEMVNHLMCLRDIYPEHVNSKSVQLLINEYQRAIKQLHALSKSWEKYHKGNQDKKDKTSIK